MSAITISLDGLEDSHDWMRGAVGSYQRALRAIGIIAAESRLNSDVVTCVNKRNLAELPQIHDILAGLGVKQWRLFTIIPIGRAAADPDILHNAPHKAPITRPDETTAARNPILKCEL